MSDILYAGSGATGSGSSWFGRNSDHHPSEAQALCIVPARRTSDMVTLGTRSFGTKDQGFAYVLSRPSWMLGGTMGLNVRGVAIGLTDASGKQAAAKDGVTGAEILRAALATAASAKDALDFICQFTEKHEQGGNSAFRGTQIQSSNYFICDRESAFVLETTGKRWAWRPAADLESMSDCFVIDVDYKRLDTQTRKEIAPVNERAACSDEADPGRKGSKESWKDQMENRTPLRALRSEERRAGSLAAITALKGKIDAAAIFGCLRSHLACDPAKPGHGHKESLCIHPAFELFAKNQATTASMAIEYRSSKPDTPSAGVSAVLWFSGTSLPCISLYKPVLLVEGSFVPLWSDYDYSENAEASLEYWKRQSQRVERGLGRKTGSGGDAAFAAKRDAIQKKIIAALETALSGSVPHPPKAALDKAIGAIGAAVREWESFLD